MTMDEEEFNEKKMPVEVKNEPNETNGIAETEVTIKQENDVTGSVPAEEVGTLERHECNENRIGDVESRDVKIEDIIQEIIEVKTECMDYELEEGELIDEEDVDEQNIETQLYTEEVWSSKFAEEQEMHNLGNGLRVDEAVEENEEEKRGNIITEGWRYDEEVSQTEEEEHVGLDVCQEENGKEGEETAPEVESVTIKIEVEPHTDVEQEHPVLADTSQAVVVNAGEQELAFKTHRYFDVHNDDDDDDDVCSATSDESNALEVIGAGDSDSEMEPVQTANKQIPQKKSNLRTYGEISLEDLPPIETLQITVGDDVKLIEVGEVLHSVGVLVVVESKPNLPPLDADTILFLEGKKVLGQVFDTIGQVCRPCYTVRFNRESDIEEQGIKSGMQVFYAPESEEWTRYVFLAHLMKIRGSDASWEHDNEPPPQFIDYSDDEAERSAKAKQRGRDEDKGNEDNEGNITTKKKKVPTATLR